MAITAAEPLYSQFRDDPDFRELLEDFVISARERRSELTAAFAAGAVDEVRRQAHQIKGAGGGYGFTSLSQVASQLEEACRQPQPDIHEVGQLLELVIDHLTRVTA